MRLLTFLIITLLASSLPSCTSSSPHHLQAQSVRLSSHFTFLLKQIDSRDSLLSHKDEITQFYLDFAQLLIELDSLPTSDPLPLPTSTPLQLELARIYKLEGGREFMEDCQQSAILKLTTYERKSGKSLR